MYSFPPIVKGWAWGASSQHYQALKHASASFLRHGCVIRWRAAWAPASRHRAGPRRARECAEDALPFALDGNAGRVVTFLPSRTTPSRDAQGRLVDQPFESRFLSQSSRRKNVSASTERRKESLFQRHLRRRPETTLPARRPISFSFRPVSPQGSGVRGESGSE
jgi:hypothetical protein